MTSPKSTPEGVAEILAALVLADTSSELRAILMPHALADPNLKEAAQALHDLYTQRFREAIGAEENDTAPDGEIMRDPIMRNRLRAEAIKRWEELSKGDV